ncbi:MAG: hypothetical protein JW963_22870 [Anaerolineales bacterium]|nr:hypothetical protein [Anaerolineales bacterium]
MNKTTRTRILTGLSLIGILMACNMPSAQIPQAETETPVPTANPAETATPVPTATVFVPTNTPTPEFAPFCEPDAASDLTPQCQLPIAEQSSVFCTNKNPYNLIFINPGSTYEVLSDGFKCSDAGMKDDRQMITCTGPMASTFELRVCDPACAIPAAQAELTQCPQDYLYNAQLGCCSQEPQPVDQDCVVLSLETRSCVVDCSVFTKKTTCDNNSNACIWDPNNNVCRLRK